MKRLLVAVLLISGILSGCAQNHFNVPADNFADKVKVLGVIPIVVDADSDIKHPQKEQLLQIVTDTNRKYEQQFVRKIKGTGNFYTVALMDGDPQKIFSSLMFRREKRDDATIQYNKYFLKTDELQDYLKRNNLDAVMLVVVSGLTKTDKIYSSNLFSSLTSDYNYLIMTAQIFDASGTMLWEYPNFRRRILTYSPLINLQYPDFSEAEANLSGKANLKFKSLEGIQRALDKKNKDLVLRETQESEIYGKQFNEMLDLLKYDSESDKQNSESTTEKPRKYTEPTAPVSQAKPKAAPEVAPVAVETPKVVTPPVEAPAPPALEGTKPSENIIVPATESTK
jgi:hypothetical protein